MREGGEREIEGELNSVKECEELLWCCVVTVGNLRVISLQISANQSDRARNIVLICAASQPKPNQTCKQSKSKNRFGELGIKH